MMVQDLQENNISVPGGYTCNPWIEAELPSSRVTYSITSPNCGKTLPGLLKNFGKTVCQTYLCRP